jgi:hypothetical protein
MANQYSQRNWKQEITETASRFELCVVFPAHLTANTRVRFSCPHGVVKNTVVGRLVSRQFCCKSQASKAHDPEQKRRAAIKSWQTGREKHLDSRKRRWDQPGEKERHSLTMLSALSELRESGWFNPGYGYGPSEKERKLPGTLYLVRYLDESGTHFKIGITKRSLKERLGDHLISIIQLHYATLGECFDLEQKLLKWAKDSGYRYSSSTTTELIHPAAIPLLLKNDNFFTLTSTEGLV